MTRVAVLERVSRVAPLGVRLRDEATGAYVSSGLSVSVHPASEPELRTRGVANSSGVFVFSNLPGMRTIERGLGDSDYWAAQTPRFAFVLEVRDLSDRFLPFRLSVLLPQRRILGVELPSPPSSAPVQVGREEGWLPLYSSPARATVDGMGVLRATLVDNDTGQPAAWALVEAKAGEQRLVTGMADREGRVMLPLFYPKPVITLGSPAGGNTPLTEQTWPVDFTIRYRRRTPLPEIPDLADVLTQPAARVLEQSSPPIEKTPRATLQFARELRLTSSSGGAATSTLLITPAGSPP